MSEELTARVAELARAIDARVKAMAPVAKRLARVDAAQLGSPRGLGELAALVQGSGLDRIGLGAEAAALAEALTAARAAVVETRRSKFFERFRAAFAGEGVTPALKAEAPPEYRCGRFHVLLDFDGESAELAFARLPVERGVALDGDHLHAAWRRVGERLAAASVEPARFAPAVAGAYRALLARRGKPGGERVELCDLYAETAFALQPEKFREDVDRRTLTPYPRVQFVWDLLRWRAEAQLVYGGERADLGVAVAGAANQKKRAFWLEDEAGAGMFYSSFRMVARETGARETGARETAARETAAREPAAREPAAREDGP